MKTKTLLVLALASVVPAMACAKKPKKTEPVPVVEEQTVQAPVEEYGEPTPECRKNLSLFNEDVKNKLFEKAYGEWWQVYTECPNANKAIYSQGIKILEWKYKNAQTDEERNDIRNLMMELYDKRIRFFGNDPKYPTAYILGQKALDYATYFPEDVLKEEAYGWLKTSVEGMGVASQLQVLNLMAELTYNLYRSNPGKYADQYINDYQVITGHMAAQAADAANKNAAAAAQYKDVIDQRFAQSGAADCETIDKQYKSFVEQNSTNLEELNKVLRLYQRVRCTESDVYFMASEFAHKLNPSEESAAGCAKMYTKKGDYREAVKYLEEAVKLAATNPESENHPEDYLYSIAMIQYLQFKDLPKAREYALRALKHNKAQGRCYILIGKCYANTTVYGAPDYSEAKAAILNRALYWAAVDKFMEAKRVDSSCAAEADALIKQYQQYFPTEDHIFDLPAELGGPTFTIGGWVNETTSVRPRP